MITPEQIYKQLAYGLGLPCMMYGRDGMVARDIIDKDGWCDKHCEDYCLPSECWKRYFEVTLGENSNEDSKVSRKENRS